MGQYRNVHCITVKWSTFTYSALRCSALGCSAVQCSAVQYSAVQCSTVQCSTVQCSTVQCTSVQLSAVDGSSLVFAALTPWVTAPYTTDTSWKNFVKIFYIRCRIISLGNYYRFNSAQCTSVSPADPKQTWLTVQGVTCPLHYEIVWLLYSLCS